MVLDAAFRLRRLKPGRGDAHSGLVVLVHGMVGTTEMLRGVVISNPSSSKDWVSSTIGTKLASFFKEMFLYRTQDIKQGHKFQFLGQFSKVLVHKDNIGIFETIFFLAAILAQLVRIFQNINQKFLKFGPSSYWRQYVN